VRAIEDFDDVEKVEVGPSEDADERREDTVEIVGPSREVGRLVREKGMGDIKGSTERRSWRMKVRIDTSE
jgi:hypothetical protein